MNYQVYCNEIASEIEYRVVKHYISSENGEQIFVLFQSVKVKSMGNMHHINLFVGFIQKSLGR